MAAIAPVAVADALGLVLATTVDAPLALPPFANSAMDGFAVRAADVVSGSALPVAFRIPAGTRAPALAPGAAAAIMTGAPVPRGADTVIPVEESDERPSAGGGTEVSFSVSPATGAFLRPAGSDVRAGDPIARAGTRLAPHRLGALAAAGIETVDVWRPPRVAVLSTGSELVSAGQPLGPGQIYESNSTLLAALVATSGARVASVGTVGDDGGFAAALDAACDSADLVITTGGVSAGEHEPVRDLLAGADGNWFGAVAMQPGGPQGLARRNGTPVLCLPGNPVSVLVSFEVFVRDALHAVLGRPPVRCGRGRVLDPVASAPGKTQFLRGRTADGNRVAVIGGPSSHLIATASQADVLVEVPADLTELTPDLEVPLWPLTMSD